MGDQGMYINSSGVLLKQIVKIFSYIILYFFLGSFGKGVKDFDKVEVKVLQNREEREFGRLSYLEIAGDVGRYWRLW